MIVKDLIEKLKLVDQNAHIVINKTIIAGIKEKKGRLKKNLYNNNFIYDINELKKKRQFCNFYDLFRKFRWLFRRRRNLRKPNKLFPPIQIYILYELDLGEPA